MESRHLLAADLLLEPSADTAVLQTDPATNFGASASLFVAGLSADAGAESLLKFWLPTSLGDFSRAIVWLNPLAVDREGIVNEAIAVQGGSWLEGSVNWLNRPAGGLPLGIWTVSAGNAVGIDVTEHVRGLLAQPRPGDMDFDGDVDFDDIPGLVLALSDAAAYRAQYGVDASWHGDLDGDGDADFDDITPFVAMLAAPPPRLSLDLRIATAQAAVEPSTVEYGSREAGISAGDRETRPRLVFAYDSPTKVIDFETDAAHRPLPAGELVAEQWAAWGVHVAGSLIDHPPAVFDSSFPTAVDSDLGTPHADFLGPGLGEGGAAGQPGENHSAAGRILVLADSTGAGQPVAYRGEATITFDLDQSSTIHEIEILSAGKTNQTLWGVNEDDGRFFSLGDYTQPAATFTDYGPLKYVLDQVVKNIGIDVEALAIDSNSTAYLAINKSLLGYAAPVLVRLDLTRLVVGGPNQVQFVGSIASTGLNISRVNGLAFHPVTGQLFGVAGVSGADRLLMIDPAMPGQSVATAAVVGAGQSAVDVEDMAFDSAGNLYLTDNEDDHLYRIDPSTGTILDLVDADQAGGLLVGGEPVGSVKFEGLAWDPLAGRLIGSDDEHALLAHLSLAPGGNTVLGQLTPQPGLGDVEGIQFVPVVEPAGEIRLYDEIGSLIHQATIQSLGKNAVQTIALGIAAVRRAEIHLPNGGAVTEFSFSPDAGQPVVLVEGNEFLVEYRQTLTVPQGAEALTFRFADLSYDNTDIRSMNDAFEVALLDGNHRPVTGTIGRRHDAVLNLSEDQPPLLGGGVVYDPLAGTVSIDIAHLQAGSELSLVTRLVNNDGVRLQDDTATRVEVYPGVEWLAQSPVLNPTKVTPVGERTTARDIDWDTLSDVSSSVSIDYLITSFDPESAVVSATLELTSDAAFSIRGPLLLAVRGISRPLVAVAEASGLDPSGAPYYDVTDRILAGAEDILLPGERSETITIGFANPQQLQFDYELVLLGHLNEPPQFDSTPPERVAAGRAWRYRAVAIDPETDAVHYTLLSSPAGMAIDSVSGEIVWQTSDPADIGRYSVVIVAEDSFGAQREQVFSIEVVAADANHPPVFTSDPPVDAYVGHEYLYESTARDDDGDDVTFALVTVEWPDGWLPTDPMWQIVLNDRDDPERGVFLWNPPYELVGKTVWITEAVSDPLGAEARRRFPIALHADPQNQPPYFVTQPPPTHRLVVPVGQTSGQVTPSESMWLELAPEETQTSVVTVTVPAETVPVTGPVDVFLLMDDTASFQDVVRSLQGSLPSTLRALEQTFAGVDFGFGIGRFEDYGGYDDFDTADIDRPFILNQPIITPSTLDPLTFDDAIVSALFRDGPGGGGDEPETLIEALYQVATGAGFDGDDDGNTTGSGAAGSIESQTYMGGSGDVPAFTTFVANSGAAVPNLVLPPAESGTTNGVGFRADSMKIVLVATDGPIAYQPSELETIIQGIDDVTVPLGELTYRSRAQTPQGPNTTLPRGATIQQSVDALVGLGAIVVGLGGEGYLGNDPADPLDRPRGHLEALAKLTGGINRTSETIPATNSETIVIDPIEPGDPLYFVYDHDPNASVASAERLAATIGAAVSAVVRGLPRDLSVESTDPIVTDSRLIDVHSAAGNDVFSFEVAWTGDGQGHGGQLQFVESASGALHGTIPFAVNGAYTYPARAVDPDPEDRPTLRYQLLASPTPPAGAAVDGTTGRLTWQPEQTGPVAMMLRVDDGRGGFDEQPVNVLVELPPEDNLPPIIDSLPPGGVEVGVTYQYAVEASDPDGDRLRYYITAGKQPGMSIDLFEGVFTWKPPYQALGETASVTLSVLDGRGGRTDQPLLIDVHPGFVNQPPTIAPVTATSATVGTVYQVDVVSTDPDRHPPLFDLPLAPQGMVIDPQSGRIFWLPGESDAGTHRVVVRVRDGHEGFDLEVFDLNVAARNHDPVVLSLAPPGPVVVNSTYEYVLQVDDPDGDLLTLELAEPSPRPATMLLAGLRLTWTPQPGDEGTSQTIRIVVRDAYGGQTSETLVLDVDSNAPNSPPRIDSLPPQTVHLGGTYYYAIAATDPNGDPLEYELVAGEHPPGMVVHPELPNWIVWNPAGAGASLGSHDVRIRVRDARGAAVDQAFSVEVTSQPSSAPPTIIAPLAPSAVAGSTYRYEPQALDPDDDTLFWSLKDSPPGMVIDPQDGRLFWLPDEGDLGSRSVTLHVSDGRGGEDEHTFSIDVFGRNRPPRFTSSPVTRAVAGGTLVYTPRVFDPEGDALVYTLPTFPTSVQLPLLNPLTGDLFWQPALDDLGSHLFVLRVDDGAGNVVDQPFMVSVVNGPAPLAPEIESTALRAVKAGVLYNYQVVASDADDPVSSLVYSVIEGPPGMAFQTDPAGLLAWLPQAGDEGFHWIEIEVADPTGLTAIDRYLLEVRASNQAPLIAPQPQSTVIAGSRLVFDTRAVDPDGDRLRYQLDAASLALGLSIDNYGRVLWDTQATTPLGSHAVSVTAVDPVGASASQLFDVQVVADDEPPQVEIFVGDWQEQLPLDAELTVWVTAADNVAVAARRLFSAGSPVPLDQRGFARVRLDTLGSITWTAAAEDPAGNVGFAEPLLVTVIDPANTQPPTAIIESPTMDARIDVPLDVYGTVLDESPGVTFDLEIARSGSDQFMPIALGVAGPRSSEPLGRIDPTRLESGSYQLRLTARDSGGNTRVDRRDVHVSGDLKLGNFSLSLVDLTLVLDGMPIEVRRTYDTLAADRAGDFGYGWELDIPRAQLQVVFEDEALAPFDLYQPFADGTRVTVLMPDGTSEGFTFHAVPGTQAFGLAFDYRPAFFPDPGVTSRLTVPEIALLRLGDEYVDAATGEPYHPAIGGNYTLTNSRGTVWSLDAVTGELISQTDPGGRTLYIDESGIRSSGGAEVRFERDQLGRIEVVTDPAGKRIRYQYDSAGDLVAVTDRVGGQTRYVYTAPQPHYLSEIVGPHGASLGRLEYDATSGRLATFDDAAGLIRPFDYDLQPPGLPQDRFLERVEDGLGGMTEWIRDPRGKIVREIRLRARESEPVKDRYVVTVREFDSAGNLTREGEPFEVIDLASDPGDDGDRYTAMPVVWRLAVTYGSNGRPEIVTDALGNSTYYSYDDFGRQLTATDPLGNTTHWQYGDGGNVRHRFDALGTRALTNTLGPHGEILESRDAADQLVADYGYDGLGRLETISGVGTPEYSLDYDANGNPTGFSYTWTDPAGQLPQQVVSVVNQWDDEGRLMQSWGPDGESIVRQYNALGHVVELRDDENDVQRHLYDAQGRLIEVQFADGTLERLVYDALGRIEILGARVIPGDVPDAVRRIYDPLGRVVRTEYLENAEIVLVEDPLAVDLDGNPFLRSELVPGWTVRAGGEQRYDASGRVIEADGILGETTRYEYDPAGRLAAIIHPGAFDPVRGQPLHAREETVYDAAGRVLTVRRNIAQWSDGVRDESAVQETRFVYDDLGRLKRTVHPDGSHTEAEYDATGRRLSETDVLNRSTLFEYNELGRLSAVNLPEVDDPYAPGQLVRPRYEYGYDEYGNLASVRDNLALVDGEVRADHIPGDGVDDESRRTRMEYNALGMLIQRELPEGEREEWFYEDGELKWYRDASGRVTEQIFNQLGQLEETRYFLPGDDPLVDPPAEIVSTIYNALGQPLEASGSRGTMFWDYLDGRLSRVESPEGVVGYHYDPLGRLQRTYTGSDSGDPDAAVEYQYDTRGRIERIRKVASGGEPVPQAEQEETVFAYEMLGGQLEQIVYPNGVITRYGHDALNRVENVTHFGPDATPGDLSDNPVLASFAYSYLVDGRRESATETYAAGDVRIEWTYDGIGRLTEESYDSYDDLADFTARYTYDLVGNRLTKLVSYPANPAGDESIQYEYDANDRLLRETVLVGGLPSRVVTYSYMGSDLMDKTVVDSAGLTLETTSYTYNVQGRTESVQLRQFTAGVLDAVRTIDYEYDHLGRQVTRAESWDADADGQADTITEDRHLIDGQSLSGYWQIIETARYDGGLPGAWLETIEYTHGPLPIGQRTRTAGSPDGVSLFLQSDVQGSTRLVSDTSGAALEAYAYDAFGNRLSGGTSPVTDILFHGRPFDAAAGHYQMRARYYQPETGRFSSSDPFPADPSSPRTLHRYLFSENDPVNNSDPTGLFTLAGVSVGNAIRAGLDFGINVHLQLSLLGAIRQTIVGELNYNQIVHQPRALNNATILTHGVAGMPIGLSRTSGWSREFQNDLRNTGLTTSDFVEFTWSGFDVSGFGVVPNGVEHFMAVRYYDLVLRTTWSKGYDKIHIVGHSWGTALSYDVLDRSPVTIQHWITLGSPLRANTPKPNSVAGDWVDFYSNSDPVTWLNMHPPFSHLGLLGITWQSAAVRVNADRLWNVTGMAVPFPGTFLNGIQYEHGAYWEDLFVLAQIFQRLK